MMDFTIEIVCHKIYYDRKTITTEISKENKKENHHHLRSILINYVQ